MDECSPRPFSWLRLFLHPTYPFTSLLWFYPLLQRAEGLATLQEQLRKVESDRAGLPRSEEEEELGRLLATARGKLARLQAELEGKEGAEKGDQDGGKEE